MWTKKENLIRCFLWCSIPKKQTKHKKLKNLLFF
jgi:hypothetical protein